MTPTPSRHPTWSRSAVALDMSADVVVVGGGPAATWTALSAAESGADVVRAEPVLAALAVAS
jgi:glycine/D-amino acid oxidase-like deaminating enzyme